MTTAVETSETERWLLDFVALVPQGDFERGFGAGIEFAVNQLRKERGAPYLRFPFWPEPEEEA